jgi:hypothetical protein
MELSDDFSICECVDKDGNKIEVEVIEPGFEKDKEKDKKKFEEYINFMKNYKL